MNGWVWLVTWALAMSAVTVWDLRRTSPAQQAWWRSLVTDPVAVTGGLVAGFAVLAVTVADGNMAGIPSALLVALTVTAVIARGRVR